jgi:hypothetical protein
MNKHFFILITIVSLSMITSAGPNNNAELYINFGTDTAVIDSLTYHTVSDTFLVGIQINKSVSLFGYQLLVSYDTTHLQFIKGTKDHGSCKNILETLEGSVTFICEHSKEKSSSISIGATILGNDKETCPNGSGFLAFLKFKKLTSDTTSLIISNPLLLDYDLVEDSKVKTATGKIFPGSSSVINRSKIQNRFSIQKNGSLLTIYTKETAPQIMQLFTINGKCVKQIHVNTQKTSFSLPSTSGKGTYVLRILNSNNEQTSFRIIN